MWKTLFTFLSRLFMNSNVMCNTARTSFHSVHEDFFMYNTAYTSLDSVQEHKCTTLLTLLLSLYKSSYVQH